MKTMFVLCCLFLLSDFSLEAKELKRGDEWPLLRTVQGKIYRQVRFTFVSPREVRFMHSNGSSSLPLNMIAVSEDVTIAADMPTTVLGPLGAMMSPEERKLSGVDKLTNQEQSRLAAWLKKAVNDSVQAERQKNADAKTGGEIPLPTTLAIASAPPETSALTPSKVVSVPVSSSPAEPLTVTIKASLPPVEDMPPEDALALQPLSPPRASPALLPPVAGGSSRGYRVPAATRQGLVESQIQGEFHGFATGRKFQLANGQWWQQDEAYMSSHASYRPMVMIYPIANGWLMSVDGVEKTVRVAPVSGDAVASPLGMARG